MSHLDYDFGLLLRQIFRVGLVDAQRIDRIGTAASLLANATEVSLIPFLIPFLNMFLILFCHKLVGAGCWCYTGGAGDAVYSVRQHVFGVCGATARVGWSVAEYCD